MENAVKNGRLEQRTRYRLQLLFQILHWELTERPEPEGPRFILSRQFETKAVLGARHLSGDEVLPNDILDVLWLKPETQAEGLHYLISLGNKFRSENHPLVV